MELIATFLYLCSIMMCLTQAQRPSFAGRRPPDGLTQKDKYYLDSLQNSNALQNSVSNFNTNSQTNEFQTRFGNVATNRVTTTNLAFGQAQRPPVGVPVVVAESVRHNSFLRPSSIAIAQRFGNNDTNDNNEMPIGFAQNNDANAANGYVNNPTNCTNDNSIAATCSLPSNNINNTNNVTKLYPVPNSIPVAASSFVTSNASTWRSTSVATTAVEPLPLDALGDRLLVEQLKRFPIDKRPFWFLNYKAIEAQRNSSTPNVALSQTRPFFAGR